MADSWAEKTLRRRHNGRDNVSNHQPHQCLLNRLFRRRSKKKTLKLRVTGLVGNSPVASEFPTQMASNAENVSIWWRHHGCLNPGTEKVPLLFCRNIIICILYDYQNTERTIALKKPDCVWQNNELFHRYVTLARPLSSLHTHVVSGCLLLDKDLITHRVMWYGTRPRALFWIMPSGIRKHIIWNHQ